MQSSCSHPHPFEASTIEESPLIGLALYRLSPAVIPTAIHASLSTCHDSYACPRSILSTPFNLSDCYRDVLDVDTNESSWAEVRELASGVCPKMA